MPLNTAITRDGELLSLRWGDFHVAAMIMAASFDSGKGPYKDMEAATAEALELMERQGCIAISGSDAFQLASYGVIGQTPLNSSDYTVVNHDWKFLDKMDGEEFEIKKGDVLSMSRSMR